MRIPAYVRLFTIMVYALPIGGLLGWLAYDKYPEGAGRTQFAVLFGLVTFFVISTLVRASLDDLPRKLAARQVTLDCDVSASIEIPRPAPEVWARIEDPSFALLHTNCVGAERMSNTARGVGEVQAFLYRVDDKLALSGVEIIEYEAGRRARACPLPRTSTAIDEWTEWIVDPMGQTSCRVTIAEHVSHRARPTKAAREWVSADRDRRQSALRDSLQQLATAMHPTG